MYNHARTLLLNQSPSRFQPGLPGYELIDATFRPQALTPGLRAAWEALYGRAPEDVFLLTRTARYIAVLHGSRCRPLIEALDPRFTYAVAQSRIWDAAPGTETSKLPGTDDPIYVFGNQDVDYVNGRARWEWRIRITASDAATVQLLNGSEAVEQTISIGSGGLAVPFPLPGSGLQARVTPGVGNGWTVRHTALWNGDSPAEILERLRSSGDAAFREVFRRGTPDGNQEPWEELAAIWSDHPDDLEKLGAYLTGFILAAEALRG